MVRATYGVSVSNVEFSINLILRSKHGLVGYDELIRILKSQNKSDDDIQVAIKNLECRNVIEVVGG